MDLRELLARAHIPQSLFLDPLHNNSYPVSGVYALVCTIIAYSIAKMFGFGSRNEFIVEGKVCYTLQYNQLILTILSRQWSSPAALMAWAKLLQFNSPRKAQT